MDILVNVSNQKLKIATNLKSLVAGTQEFVKFTFNLTDDWDGLLTFAQFKQNGVAYNVCLDEDNSAYLPPEIGVGTCTLMLYGSKNKTIATTNYITLIIDENILVSDANSTEISESLYNQLVNKVNTLQGYAESANEAAERANTKAQEADNAASEANTAKTEAFSAASLANTAADEANTAASRANNAADYACMAAGDVVSVIERAERVNISAVQTETGATVTVTDRDGIATSVNIDTLSAETLESFSVETEQIKSEIAELKESKADKPFVPDIDPVFANNSWETIAYVSKHLNPADYWNIGDVKNLSINGVEIPIVIIGFNHDRVADSAKSAYGKATAGMTLQIGAMRKTVGDMTLNSILDFSTESIPVYDSNGAEIGTAIITNPILFDALPWRMFYTGQYTPVSQILGAEVEYTLVTGSNNSYTWSIHIDCLDDTLTISDLGVSEPFYVIYNEGVSPSSGFKFTTRVKNRYTPSEFCGGYNNPNQPCYHNETSGIEYPNSFYWGNSQARIELQGILNGTEVTNHIVPVKKYTSRFYNTSNLYAAPEITDDKVFLLSEYEEFGDTKYSPFREGDHYEYYKDGNSKFSWSNSAIQNVVHKGYREFSWLRSTVANKVNSTNPTAPYNCAVSNEVNRYSDDIRGGLSVNYQPDNNTRYFSNTEIYIADTATGKGDGSSPGNRMGNDDTYTGITNNAYKGSALYKAFDKLKDTGGTIVVCGDLTLNRANALRDSAAEFPLPSNGYNLIQITGYKQYSDSNSLGNIILDKSTYNVNLSIKGMTIWRDINFSVSAIKTSIKNRNDATFMFECNGYKTVFSYGIKINRDDTTNPLPTICGHGRYGETSEEAAVVTYPRYSSVTVKSGNWEEICGTIFSTLGNGTNKYSAGSAQINFVGGSVKYISGGSSYKNSINSVFYGNININILSNNFTTLAFPRTDVSTREYYENEYDAPITVGGQVSVNIVGIESFSDDTVITGRSTTSSTDATFDLKSSYEISDTVLDYAPASGFETQTVVADLTPTYTDAFFYGKILPCFCL